MSPGANTTLPVALPSFGKVCMQADAPMVEMARLVGLCPTALITGYSPHR